VEELRTFPAAPEQAKPKQRAAAGKRSRPRSR
jgi:hypothetical protein